MKNYYELFIEFFLTDFKLRYKHSFLGLVWSVIKPLSIFTLLYVVWSTIFHTTSDFALYLLLGIVTLNFFNEGVTFGLQSLYNKSHIILKVNFPREIVVMSSVAVAILNFSINLLIFFVFWEVSNGSTTLNGILLILFSLLTLFVFVLALSLFLSIWSVRFYDIKHLVELILQLMFWATPVVYKIDVFSGKMLTLLKLNPMTWILNGLRTGFLSPTSITRSDFLSILPVFTIVSVIFILGLLFFKRQIPKIAEYF